MNIPCTVKDNFKMPERRYSGRPVTNPIGKLAVGQTALFDVKSRKEIDRLRGMVGAYTSKYDRRFVTRTIGALPDAKFAVQRLKARAK